MGYVKATDVLPQDLLDRIQNYIDGEYIYIPRKTENRKAWGEKTNTKAENLIRNMGIYSDYLNGVTVDELSEKYFLSPKSIQRIILTIQSEKK
ncbi:Mor transcription activator family protein [Anaerovirgula multivorans]|uniref:Mor transcription activator family protein n=1 Tax=Anaerovirgula multivorans TaxID=312168 RepID=A0A239J883_9FIRM|nr:CD3324 family protein [Anaerovirgula multivorans]SNT02206.1 Mor transcription activator family protein [Anaerovirgula multivorans]